MEIIVNMCVVAVLILLGGWFVVDLTVLQPRRWAEIDAEESARFQERAERDRRRRTLEQRRAAREPLAERIRNMR